jgi:hypothetical protein
LTSVLQFIHLTAAAVWVGGLVVLGSIAAGLRRAGAAPEVMRVMARSYGRVAWSAMAGAVITGLWSAERLSTDLASGAGIAKLSLVGAATALAGIHQATARLSSPAVRGALQAAILAVSFGIVAAAVAL